MFGRGQREAKTDEARADGARADGARADEATVDGTTAPRQAYTDGATTARPTFTPAEDDDAPTSGAVVSDTPVTPADDGQAHKPVARTRMAYDRPTAVGEPRYNRARPAGGVRHADRANREGRDDCRGTGAAPGHPDGGPPVSALNAGPMADLDQPLFSDAKLASQWQRVQAGFVDDPRDAVSEAADLVEQAAEALADALRERQTRLRALWDGNGANGTGRDGADAAAAAAPATPRSCGC